MSKGRRLNLFVATGGHAFARDAFEAMLRAADVQPCFVDQPAAALLMNPDGLRGFDAVVLHDMPGMDFGAPVEDRPEPLAPPPALMKGVAALVEQGMGFVAIHHALAGWPAWPAYAELLGGAFLYRPRVVRGELRRGSAYCREARYDAIRSPAPHPVLVDVPERFELVDEPYDQLVFDSDIEPLLWRGSIDGAFMSATHAVRRQPDPGDAPPAPERAVIGWATSAGNSPVVVLQPGDSAATFANPAYRTLVGNAVHWVASPEARAWAAERARNLRFDAPLAVEPPEISNRARAAPAEERP